MAPEIPLDLIRKLQASLREGAGLPSYDPSDPELPGFASFREVFASLDQSVPSYLKCKQCQAKLLRGIHSTFCVYCGADQRRDLPSTMSFTSTLAYRQFLGSLDLDGSEPVSLESDTRTSGKAQNALPGGMVLSDLLNLELRWPPEEEGKEVQNISSSGTHSQSTQSLNLSGVDLDNFFSETKVGEPSLFSSISQESETNVVETSLFHNMSQTAEPNEEISSAEVSASEPESFGFFENIQSSHVPMTSFSTHVLETSFNSRVVDDSFADWDADFQSADVSTPSTDNNSVEFFPSLTTGPLNKHDSKNVIVKNENNNQQSSIDSGNQSSTTSSWIADDQWHTAAAGTSSIENFAPVSNSSIEDDLWATGKESAINTSTNNDEGGDSFDAWQDFKTTSQMETDKLAPIGKANDKEDVTVTFRSSENALYSTDTDTTNINKNNNEDSFDIWQGFNTTSQLKTDKSSVFSNVENKDDLHARISSVEADLWAISTTSMHGNERKDEDDDDFFDVWQDSSTAGQLNTANTVVGRADIKCEFPPMISSSIQGDLWGHQRTADQSSSNRDEHNVSLDTWQDFNSTKGTPKALTQTGERTVFSLKPSCGMSMVGVQDTSKDEEFGGFLQSGPITGEPAVQDDSANMNNFQREALDSNRMDIVREQSSFDSTLWAIDSKSASSTTAKQETGPSVDDLLAQMSDLSFMLKNELSIPANTKSSDSAS